MSPAAPSPAGAPRSVSFPATGGVTLRGDAWGDPEGRPVLLLHGGGQTRHSWASCGATLGAHGWRAMALDLRGHGESDWAPEGNYEPESFVGDLRAVCEQLSAPPVVVGASLGGITGLIAAGEHPGCIAALVLVDITPNVQPEGIERIVNFMLEKPDGFASLEEAADSVARYRQHRGRPKDLSGLKKNLRLGEDGRWRWHWDPAFMDRPRMEAARARGEVHEESGRFTHAERLLEASSALEIPVLLVRGRSSDVVSEDGAKAFLEAVPHARYADVAGAGHMVAGDRNDAFNDAVLDFLREALGEGGVAG